MYVHYIKRTMHTLIVTTSKKEEYQEEVWWPHCAVHK